MSINTATLLPQGAVFESRLAGRPGSERLARALGRPCGELATPALLLRLDALQRNLGRMQALVQPPTRLRPHAKTHKSPQVAALQVAGGAIGATTATVWEAKALAEAGIGDLLIANEVVGAERIACLTEISRSARVTVAVDGDANAQDLSRAASAAGSTVGVVVDVDVGLGRCGVRSVQEGVALSERIAELPGLDLRGVMGFEGHCTFEPDDARRAQLAGDAMARLLEVADAIASTGAAVDVVSAGGTGTFDSTGATAGITELQAGSYAFMDTSHAAIVPGFDYALTILATVLSRHGRTTILDCGKKSIGLESPAPLLLEHASTVQYVAEEHTVLELGEVARLNVGDRVEVVPSYCPVAVNLHDVYFVVDEGIVVDVWPILARGAGWTSAGA